MNKRNKIRVIHKNKEVGVLVAAGSGRIAFQYSREWLNDGFSLNPFSLPLREEVFLPKYELFDGLFGVFADSLPDGWGRLLIDRLLVKNKIDPHGISSLERLAIVADNGMGALEYLPAHDITAEVHKTDKLDYLAAQCREMLLQKDCSDLENLVALGGSSGGARPKVLTIIDGENWIIKFPAEADAPDIGKQEYDYSLCARNCGIEMSETRLFPSSVCKGYFGVKRFDRQGNNKIFMESAAALLETSHRIPNLDYNILMRLTATLCRSEKEIEKMFRLMCFNVYAHNRDDHSKNFSFIYDDIEKRWRLSPAYDLTYSYSFGGEHATMVNGNGRNPSTDDVLAVGKNAGIKVQKAKRIAKEVEDCCCSMLQEYLRVD